MSTTEQHRALATLADELDRTLAPVDSALAQRYPGDPGDPGTRRPVHTVYVPADRYTEHTTGERGAEARAALGEHGRSAAAWPGLRRTGGGGDGCTLPGAVSRISGEMNVMATSRA